MKASKIVFFIIFVVLLSLGLIFLSNAIKNTFKISLRQMGQAAMNSASEKLEDFEFGIYWIGDCPEPVKNNVPEITFVPTDAINGDNMPIVWSDVEYTIYAEDGSIVEHVVPRDYPHNMLIVVNNVTDLSEDSLEVIRQCAVDNKVPVLLIGRDTISAFREYINWSPKDYESDDTMLFSVYLDEGVTNPIDMSIINDRPEQFMASLFEFMTNTFSEVNEGRASEEETLMVEMTEMTETTEIETTQISETIETTSEG